MTRVEVGGIRAGPRTDGRTVTAGAVATVSGIGVPRRGSPAG